MTGSGPRRQGTCPVCGCMFSVSKAGKVMRHYAGLGKVGPVCPGSGRQEANLPRGS